MGRGAPALDPPLQVLEHFSIIYIQLNLSFSVCFKHTVTTCTFYIQLLSHISAGILQPMQFLF
jgi:hypothetical protein